jgi:hypothetical protein
MAKALIGYDFLIINCTQNLMFLPNGNFVLGHIIPTTTNGYIFFGSSPSQHNHTKQKASNIGMTTRKIGLIRKTKLIGCYLHISTQP